MTITRYGASLAAVVIAIACCVAPAAAAINAGDHLTVHVYNHPELSANPVVDSRGVVQLPVIGAVRVAGLSSKDVADVIKQRISAYVPYPAVDVQDTSESQQIFITGVPGGVLQYAPNETLGAAVAEVGKALPFADNSTTPPNAPLDRFDHSRIDLKSVRVFRDDKLLGTFDMIALRDAGNPGPMLYANDTIAFANKPVPVTVIGAVGAPGSAYLWPSEPLADAIIQVGGPSIAAATSHVEIAHAGELPHEVALGDAVFNEPAQPGDVITVPTAPRVTVEGLVQKPGVVTLQNDFTLLSAIAGAGGYNKFGDLRKVEVVDHGVLHQYNIVALAHGDATQNPVLHDGDSVFVPEGYKIDWGQFFQGVGSFSGFGYDIFHL